MSEPLVFVDSSEIREGKLEELKTAIKGLVEFVEANEPAPIAYNVFFNSEGTRMTVVQIHPDSASMEFHMKVAASAFPKFADLLKLLTMDIYGKPSDALLEAMRQKARMLGLESVLVHEFHAGFTRI